MATHAIDNAKRLLEVSSEERRDAAQKRGEEILSLLEEQEKEAETDEAARVEKTLKVLEEEPDYKGFLWGEKLVSEMEDGDEEGKDWEVLHRYVPDFRTPELIAANREICRIALERVRRLGEETYRHFCEWLDHSTIVGIAEEQNLPYTELLSKIKAAVAECRSRFDTNPKVFPFLEPGGKVLKKIRWAKWDQRYRDGGSPADPEKAIQLTPAEQALSLDKLMALLKSRGAPSSRASARRTKERGWYYPMWSPGRTGRLVGGRVEVSEADRKLPVGVLAKKSGISSHTAALAKKRGWFMRNSQNKNLPHDPSAAESAIFKLPERIECTPDGRAISSLKLDEIAKTFGFSNNGTTSRIRKKSFFSTKTWKMEQRLRFVEVTGFVDLSTPDSRVEVRKHLAQCEGEGWRTKMVRCALCGSELPLGEATIDHIVPKAQGGGDYLSNLQLAHDGCNKDKGGMAFGALGEALKKARKEEGMQK